MNMKLTKIVATISGSCCNAELIGDLAERGMNVVRFNTAHTTVEEFERAANAIRIVRPYLQDADLIAILGKHAQSVPQSNVCCLAHLKDLLEG